MKSLKKNSCTYLSSEDIIVGIYLEERKPVLLRLNRAAIDRRIINELLLVPPIKMNVALNYSPATDSLAKSALSGGNFRHQARSSDA